VVDLSVKRELNRGFGDALATAFELAVTPAVMALIGWAIDSWLGTGPIFLVFLFAFTMTYEIWKMFKRYELRMQGQEAQVKGLRPRGAAPAGDEEPQP
jgi:F0F1-type ATP synthase assembly protein I